MTNILQQIIEFKKTEVEKRKSRLPLQNFIDCLKPSDRSLKDALNTDKTSFILECKKASPSKGMIRENFNLQKILDDYKDFANAISVLTDEKYFQGNFGYLKQASEYLELPILCKDFFIDTYQVYEARMHGADAILLMLSVLDDHTYQQLAGVAQRLNLDILTEVHDEQEMQRAIQLNAKIIGINNRNLKDLTIDLNNTQKLAQLAPKDAILIAESGIQTRKDIQQLSSYVNGFLIGSSIMAQDDIREHCKSLIYGRIKVCGLTSEAMINYVESSGSTFSGLIFYADSPRNIQLSDAIKITSNTKIKYVGVFVNEEPQKIIQIAKAVKLFAIQLHGDENTQDIQTIKNSLPEIQIWKSIAVCNQITLIDNPLIDYYLLDTYSNEKFGGSGKTFDWKKIEHLPKERLIIAGGINIENIQRAETYQCYALDINSGVESDPGVKDKQKITQLFNLLHA